MGDRETRDLLRKEQRTTPRKEGRTPRKGRHPTVADKDAVLSANVDDENKENQEHNQQAAEDGAEEAQISEKTSNRRLFPADDGGNGGGGGGYPDPVYREISRKNGYLNKQDLSTLKRICKEENIDSSGRKDLVTKRLKQFYKVKMLRDAGIVQHVNRGFDYLVVIDFEATCEERRGGDYPHEIIEFPAVLVDVVSCKIVSQWRKYVKPVLNPLLTEFCSTLTGITQETVEKSDEFPEVLKSFEEWLSENRLGSEFTFGLVTDGPFDMGRFLRLSCQHYSLPVPYWATRWINIRKGFANFYRQGVSSSRYRSPGLQTMLEKLDLKFQGSPHSGLDDAINIARVTERLLRDGATLRVNERLELAGGKVENKDRRLQQVVPVSRKEAEDWLIKCKERRS